MTNHGDEIRLAGYWSGSTSTGLRPRDGLLGTGVTVAEARLVRRALVEPVEGPRTPVGSRVIGSNGFETRQDRVGRWVIHSMASPTSTPVNRTPLLFLHGLGMSTRYLLPTLERLAPTFPLLAPDLPGCGRSSPAGRALTPEATAEVVGAWLDVAGVGRAVVIGHSVGAQVAAHLARQRPNAVQRVVLASPTGDPADTRFRQAARLLVGTAWEAPTLVPVAVRDYVRAGPRTMWRTFVRSRADDAAAAYRAVTQPTIVVRGARDTVVSRRWADLVADSTSAAPVFTIPGGPHGLPYSAAPSFAAVIEQFVE